MGAADGGDHPTFGVVCAGEVAEAVPHPAAAIRLNVESKRKSASGAIPHTFRSATSAPPQTAKSNVQTNTYAQRAGGSQIRFILPHIKSIQNLMLTATFAERLSAVPERHRNRY
jgi:hypothetical protein